jgi:Mor family transcriptional regulator
MSALLEDVRYEVAIAVDAGLQGPALVDAIIARLCWRIGGQTIHWPMTDRLRRDGEIRRDFDGGMAPNAIAKKHGVSRKTVENVVGCSG